jgi:hypothetical protein
MSTIAKDLIGQLQPDSFREENPFTDDLSKTTSLLLNANTLDERTAAFSDWLARYQPCLFGKIAARLGGVSFCFLSEADLDAPDDKIRQKIQADRRRWRAKAFHGDASGFVILAISKRIATAVPNDAVKALARRLCYLYLGRDEEDEILLEDIFLRVPGKQDALIHWKAGVNYFCAQGDGRWWRDHRIPGGMAFSVNSVGHLVKSFQVGRSLEESWEKLKLAEQEEWADFKIKSLGDALVTAMQTINQSFPTQWGKATQLLPAEREGANPRHLPCPVSLPQNLQDKDFCEYSSFYHTDVTIPSEYFRPEAERSSKTMPQPLDFTYLFDDSIDNSAFFEMGEGIQVRGEGKAADKRLETARHKIQRMHGEEGLISDHPDLREALDANRD